MRPPDGLFGTSGRALARCEPAGGGTDGVGRIVFGAAGGVGNMPGGRDEVFGGIATTAGGRDDVRGGASFGMLGRDGRGSGSSLLRGGGVSASELR